MLRFLLVRLLSSVPVLLAAAVATFVLFQVVPGDAALLAIGDRASPAELAAARHDLGLDQPAGSRFAKFLAQLGTGDLGHSLRSGRPVADEVADRLPYTIELTLVAVALAVVAGVTLGAMAATRPRAWAGRALGPAGAVLLASPVFAIALPLTWLLALRWNVLPVAGADTWRHLVLPAVTLALPSAAAVAQLSRATVAETLSADFVRTARAKGLSWAPLYLRHVFPNAAAPVLAFLGVHLGSLLGGAVVVETIFGWPGLGRLAVQAILSRDLPLAQGTVLALSAGFVLANTAADLTHRALDPRGAA